MRVLNIEIEDCRALERGFRISMLTATTTPVSSSRQSQVILLKPYGLLLPLPSINNQDST